MLQEYLQRTVALIGTYNRTGVTHNNNGAFNTATVIQNGDGNGVDLVQESAYNSQTSINRLGTSNYASTHQTGRVRPEHPASGRAATRRCEPQRLSSLSTSAGSGCSLTVASRQDGDETIIKEERYNCTKP
jgi:hypothetical protein